MSIYRTFWLKSGVNFFFPAHSILYTMLVRCHWLILPGCTSTDATDWGRAGKRGVDRASEYFKRYVVFPEQLA